MNSLVVGLFVCLFIFFFKERNQMFFKNLITLKNWNSKVHNCIYQINIFFIG